MALDVPARTPVLVGAAARSERPDDWSNALEAPALMTSAVEAAGADCGAPELLAAADWVVAMKGTWTYPDPGRTVANAIGAGSAISILADVGILQTTPFARASAAIASGEIDVAIVCGGEAKYRSLQAAIAGADEPLTIDPKATAPDQHWQPSGDIVHRLEVEHGLIQAVQQYAMIENAFRADRDQSLAEHREEIGDLWAAFNAVAQGNEDAWFREPRTVAFLTEPSTDNRMLADPYLKWHTSQWNVNQAAGFVLCSAQTAASMGVARDKWVFPWSMAESNHLRPLIQRPALHASPGFDAVFAAVLDHANRRAADLGPIEFYSCFPVAVRAQAASLALAGRPFTTTGGMAFAGGPFNNFVLQALAKVVGELRSDPGALGLVTAVSGLLTKQGAATFSTSPPPSPFQAIEVDGPSDEPAEIDGMRVGAATIVSYTVRGDRSGPVDAIALVEFDDGVRSLVVEAPPRMQSWSVDEPIGRRVTIAEPGVLTTT